MDVAKVNELTRILESKVSSIEGGSDSDRFSHFNHITRNGLQPIAGLSELYEEGKAPWRKIKDIYLSEVSVLSRYLDLLLWFPNFKEAELKTKEGYFPEKFNEPNLEYVSYAWEQLNQK